MLDDVSAADALAARARLLAQPLEATGPEVSSIQMLGFTAGDDRFGLPVQEVVTVLSSVRPTPVPGMPPWLVGAVGFRGRVVAVVEPDQFLGTPRQLDDSVVRSMAVVMAHGGAEVALLVDRLDPVESIGSGAILPCPVGSPEIVTHAARGTLDGRLFLDRDGFIAAIKAALLPIAEPSMRLADRRSIALS